MEINIIQNEIKNILIENKDEIQNLKKLNSIIGSLWVLFALIITLIILKFSALLYERNLILFMVSYPILAFIIAGRQGSFLQIVHEGAHSLIHKNKKINDVLGSIIGGLIGISMHKYRYTHGMHHVHTNTNLDDPADLEKYTITDITKKELWLLFLRDIFGVSAMTRIKNIFIKKSTDLNKETNIFYIVISQIFLLLFFKMSLINYLLLWIMPLLTVNMFLMRIRGIAEHGLPSQLKLKINLSQEGALLTRSLNTSSSKSNLAAKNIERFLIGSLSINYHLEHHLIPNIPHYNLRKTYNLLKLYENSNLRTNYQAGYFSSLWQFIK